jgi:hypothetical protein
MMTSMGDTEPYRLTQSSIPDKNVLKIIQNSSFVDTFIVILSIKLYEISKELANTSSDIKVCLTPYFVLKRR